MLSKASGPNSSNKSLKIIIPRIDRHHLKMIHMLEVSYRPLILLLPKKSTLNLSGTYSFRYIGNCHNVLMLNCGNAPRRHQNLSFV